jgi:hypothetical protein
MACRLAIMDMNVVHALVRFWLGRPGSEPLPADPGAWARAQLGGPKSLAPDPLRMANPPTTAARLAALREDRKNRRTPAGPRGRALLARTRLRNRATPHHAGTVPRAALLQPVPPDLIAALAGLGQPFWTASEPNGWPDSATEWQAPRRCPAGSTGPMPSPESLAGPIRPRWRRRASVRRNVHCPVQPTPCCSSSRRTSARDCGSTSRPCRS